MSRLLPAVVATFALSACHSSGLDEEKQDDVQQWSGDEGFADQYFIDDLACQSGEGAAAVGSSAVHFFQFGESSDQPFDFSNFGSSGGLSGPGFVGTYYDFAQTSECSRNDDETSCGKGVVTSAGKPLNVCRANDSYPRLSFEGVALTSLANLSRAAEYYRKVPGRSPGILSSKVLILPKIEKRYPDWSVMTTDNLAYAPTYGGGPAFIIYPKSKRSVKNGRWESVNLWEAPWGLAHEYGHHVFRTHTGITGLSDSLGTFDEHEHGEPGFALQARQVTAEDHWSAVNEGFADLFAFYAYGARPGLAKGLDCFEQNREVTAGSFTNGIDKRLDAAVMGEFLSPDQDKGSPCNSPSLQDSHTIGAIVAHGVDALFSTKAGGEGDEAALNKAAMLLQWANLMGVTVALGAEISVERLVLDALKVTADGTVLSPAACDSVRLNFPAYADRWLTDTFTCR